ncbi:hypothetical protein UlMin_028422 [Ulmus minor]
MLHVWIKDALKSPLSFFKKMTPTLRSETPRLELKYIKPACLLPQNKCPARSQPIPRARPGQLGSSAPRVPHASRTRPACLAPPAHASRPARVRPRPRARAPDQKERKLKRAQVETEGKTTEAKKPIVFKYGLNHVTYLIEHLFVWLPLLCKKMKIPYFIVKGKSHISSDSIFFSHIVHKKTTSILCLTTVKNEDRLEILSLFCSEGIANHNILRLFQANFNNKYEEYKKKWGGGIMGSKS